MSEKIQYLIQSTGKGLRLLKIVLEKETVISVKNVGNFYGWDRYRNAEKRIEFLRGKER